MASSVSLRKKKEPRTHLRSCQRGGVEGEVFHKLGSGLCPGVVGVDGVLVDINKLFACLGTGN